MDTEVVQATKFRRPSFIRAVMRLRLGRAGTSSGCRSKRAPVCTIAKACDRIEKLTGIRRSPTQVRKFLKGLGLKWQRIRAIPVPPKKTLAEHVQDQAEFLDTQLKPKLDAAEAGQGHVFFVDAAHFVFGTFLCCLWSFTRIFVRAASGRQRFNVLGAWNAVTRELIAVTNTTVVNTETMCELLRKIADLGLSGPITLVLDNARYQAQRRGAGVGGSVGHHAVVPAIVLSQPEPHRTTLEVHEASRLYGRYHPTFRDFQAAIQEVLDGLSTKYSQQLASLMTLNFQQFDDVSLMAA